MTELHLSLSAARALLLHAQGLDRRPRRRARKPDVLAAIRRMRALQIDTISVVARSPYLVLWSRLGDYEPRWLDDLLGERALFEYWSHEACFLPIEDYALYRHRMLDVEWAGWRYRPAFMREHGEQAARLLQSVREHGPVRSTDFEREQPAGTWWDWKPEKRMLEGLFTAGELMIARRDGFQRIYDVRERVHPTWDDALLPPAEEVQRTLALNAVRALGVAKAGWVADYFRMNRTPTRALAPRLAAEGALLQARVEGWKDPVYIHPDHADAARAAADGALRPALTTLLSPFDPVVWDRARASELFGFDYRLECYTPAPKRVYGYYVLPILRRGALIGRMDAKAHRAEGVFEVRALYLEPGTRFTDAAAADVAGALLSCARWHGTPEVRVTRAHPERAGNQLRAALAAAAAPSARPAG
jgi:uncharacterized protein YcaQ